MRKMMYIDEALIPVLIVAAILRTAAFFLFEVDDGEPEGREERAPEQVAHPIC